jgi:hypothetical protein
MSLLRHDSSRALTHILSLKAKLRVVVTKVTKKLSIKVGSGLVLI